MRHRRLGIRLARLVPGIVGKALVPPHRDHVPGDVVVEQQVRDGRGEEARLGGLDADLLRGDAASGTIALVEGLAP